MYFEKFAPGTSFEAGPLEGPPESFWATPGSSVALPGSSGKIAQGFGRVLGEKYWFFIDFSWFWAARNRRGPVLRPAGLRARGRRGAGGSSRDLLGGSRRLCGASRELWEGCRWFWKGSGQKILIFHWFLKVLGGRGGWARTAPRLGWDPLNQGF